MVIGTLQLFLTVPESNSLKDKRRVIRSLKDRLGGKHNISIAEVGALDEHRRSVIGIAMVSNDRRFTESCLSKIVGEVRGHPRAILSDFELELF